MQCQRGRSRGTQQAGENPISAASETRFHIFLHLCAGVWFSACQGAVPLLAGTARGHTTPLSTRLKTHAWTTYVIIKYLFTRRAVPLESAQ